MKTILVLLILYNSSISIAQKSNMYSNKLKASLNFLNIEFKNQFSFDYQWVDSTKQKINYNELSYKNFDDAINAFDSIKKIFKKIRPAVYKYKDSEKLSIEDLKNHTNRIITNNTHTYSDEVFNEFLLPYKVTIEPIQDWFEVYKNKFSFLNKSKPIVEQALQLKNNINDWFLCTYGIDKNIEPLPRLGALHILQRKKGLCEDAATLVVYALRSQGIAAAVDFVPAWATATGNHTLNTVFNEQSNPIHFDVLNTENTVETFVREPGKVFRHTFSSQKNTLATLLNEKEIPDGFLRTSNYKDVTNEYWDTRDLSITVNNDTSKVIYAGVWNGGIWKIIWWGKNNKGNSKLTNMGTNAVYMPLGYNGKKLIPCGNPIVNNKDKSYEILLDTTIKRNIEIKSDGVHLNTKQGETYTIYYWNNKWVKHQSLVAETILQPLQFKNMPNNALYLITTKTPNLKHRPFIVNKLNNIIWY